MILQSLLKSLEKTGKNVVLGTKGGLTYKGDVREVDKGIVLLCERNPGPDGLYHYVDAEEVISISSNMTL